MRDEAGQPQDDRWPPQDAEIHAALEHVWTSGDWGRYLGQHVPQLESQLAQMHGVAHAFTCASGTIAVELALRAAGVRAGDEVLLGGYDFPGNFRSIEAIGARPVLIDIEEDSWCLDPAQLDQLPGEVRPRALIVSHLHGGLAAMQRIRAWADARRVAVVEDACQVPGATVEGRAAGAWGDVGVLSFGGSKLLTSGRGGALLTDDAAAYQRAKIYSERGNHAFPLSELQAAVLRPQLAQLEQRNAQRAQAVARLLEQLGTRHDFQTNRRASGRGTPSFYKIAWRTEGRLRERREQLVAEAQQLGLPLGLGFRGFVRRGTARCTRVGALEQSRVAAESTVLLHHSLLLGSAAEIDHAAQQLARLVQRTSQP